MKILYLHQYFAIPESATGTRSFEFARRLIAAGHDVTIVTASSALPKNYRTLGIQRGKSMKIHGISVIVIDIPYANSMSFRQRIQAFAKFALLATLEVLKQPADVVFATSTPLTIAIPAIAAKLWHRIPLVFEVRDLWPELPIAVGALRNPVARAASRALEWSAYHASQHIVALSPGMADGVTQRGIARDRVTVIPNSCDLDLFDVPASAGQELRRELAIAAEAPLIVYVGTFGLINGVDYLVDVAAAMQSIRPDVRFLLVGAGAKYEEVTAKAHAIGVLDDNLWIRRSMPKKDIPRLLSAATVCTSLFVPLPAMEHNSANKFFDALAAGRPIAINYCGWQAELLTASGAGLVLSPTDYAGAAHELANFVANPLRVEQAGRAAQQLGRREFNREAMASRLETVLRQARV